MSEALRVYYQIVRPTSEFTAEYHIGEPQTNPVGVVAVAAAKMAEALNLASSSTGNDNLPEPGASR